jgi:hypothetical protein
MEGRWFFLARSYENERTDILSRWTRKSTIEDQVELALPRRAL